MKLNLKKLTLGLILFICIFSIIIYRNTYRYTDEFIEPYKLTIILPKTNLKNIESKNFSVKEIVSSPSTSDKNEILNITTFLKKLTVKRIDPYKDINLSTNLNILYFVPFNNHHKYYTSGDPILKSLFIFDDKQILIKIQSNGKSYYFKGFIDDSQFKIIDSLYKDYFKDNSKI